MEERKRKLKESLEKTKKDWARIGDAFEEEAKLEEAWRQELNQIISDPHALDGKSEAELVKLQIRAKSEIKKLGGGLNRLEQQTKDFTSKLPNDKSGLSSFISALGGIAENVNSNQLHKNECVLEMVEARLEAMQKPTAPPDPIAAKIARLAEIKRKWDEAKQNNDQSLWPDIDRMFAQHMDDERSKP